MIPAIALSLVAAAAAVWLVLKRSPSPEVRERRRRLDVNNQGRMTDAIVVDIQGEEIHYSYSVRGVEYLAAQDFSALADVLPVPTAAQIGPATVKYSPRNPANSIVICEEWSGLRAGGRQ
jgi:hypothetical protein